MHGVISKLRRVLDESPNRLMAFGLYRYSNAERPARRARSGAAQEPPDAG